MMNQDFINRMLSRSKEIIGRVEELDALIAAPEIIAHSSYWLKLVKERESLSASAEKAREIIKLDKETTDIRALTDSAADNSLKNELNAEINELRKKQEASAIELNELSIALNSGVGEAIIEISAREKSRASAEFAALLYEMYKNFADSNGLSFFADNRTIENKTSGTVKIKINGTGAFEILERENGVHKAAGFSGNSGESVSAQVIVIKPYFGGEGEARFDKKDVKTDVFHSGGAGGQNVNKVETAIRMTHLPTNIVVTCQNERSQLKNREEAMKTLKERVESFYNKQRDKFYAEERKKRLKDINAAAPVRIYDFILNEARNYDSGLSVSLDIILKGGLKRFALY